MNEEKDRFGEFFRLLERAREDVYFAQKNRELLEKLKRRLEQAEQGRGKHPLMKCPRCGFTLNDAILMKYPISRCSGCGGIWVDHGIVPALTKLKNLEPVNPAQATNGQK